MIKDVLHIERLKIEVDLRKMIDQDLSMCTDILTCAELCLIWAEIDENINTLTKQLAD